METTTSKLSDSELLSRFQKCSPKTGDRLVMYAELKKRNLLNALNTENPLLFKGTAPMGGTTEGILVLIGAAIICIICARFEGIPGRVAIIWIVIFICLLNMLNLVVYRSVFIYSNRISVATCLCLDRLQLKSKTMQFGEQGLYINLYYEKPLIHRLLTPEQVFFFLWSIPSLSPPLCWALPFKNAQILLNKLDFFSKSVKQNVFIEPSSQEISLAKVQSFTDLKSFCQNQLDTIEQPRFIGVDINWVRLIAVICDRNVPKEIQHYPLAMSPDWLEAEEQLVLCLNTSIAFRKKGYMFLTNHRVVWTTLSGDYVEGGVYEQINFRQMPQSSWLMELNKYSTLQPVAGPYPISSIFNFFTQGGYER